MAAPITAKTRTRARRQIRVNCRELDERLVVSAPVFPAAGLAREASAGCGGAVSIVRGGYVSAGSGGGAVSVELGGPIAVGLHPVSLSAGLGRTSLIPKSPQAHLA
jgi:hypothetical protein